MRDARKDAIEMAARRERLLEAGFRLMSARTIEAVTLQQIADEARIGIAALNRNFDTYVQHERCTAAQMRPYNDAVAVFAKKFHTVVRKARADGSLRIPVSEPRLFVNLLYTMLSVAGKYAEGLVYPPDGERNMTDELEAIKRMILDSLTGGRRL